ncbi:hypothetical protein FGG08_006171 [Glutinoglossum americanum]|uniref:PHD-type domain-containing protein n=1 Tax=Glutinoglossum americanum TaxID=1670608 RepID=A0A9P8I407_9PEZI|nr:hypothetical protein FGG08_006171 [Glutinoglossum americanum]
MSETCIVCLGNLDVLLPENPSTPSDSGSSKKITGRDRDHDKAELIAHLIPCGHNLHDECLKPWVERANRLTISSYSVKDRVQVAELDLSMIYEDEGPAELPTDGCLLCGEDSDEDHLLFCDGCDAVCHTYCAGLLSVPAGAWFCFECSDQRVRNPHLRPTNSHHLPDRRTRGQLRRQRDVEALNHGGWARVWQSVWDRLNFDLDFPYDDDQGTSSYHESQPRGRNHRFRDWERRAEVAERQGGGHMFRESAVMLFNGHAVREKPRPPPPESQEEIRAWNAFEKAKEIQDSKPKKRKSKSKTASPSDRELPEEPVRKLKRPRTRRAQDLAESSSDAAANAPNKRQKVGNETTSTSSPTVNKPVANGTEGVGPSFLQSLLKEVETSVPADIDIPRKFKPSAIDYSTPRTALSPAASSSASNHATPRALSTTPPPQPRTRPQSPTPLTSKVEPIFPAVNFSPSRSPPPSRPQHADSRRSRPQKLSSPSTTPPRSTETSPTRTNKSFSAKSDIERIVRAALNPYWHNNHISKEQFVSVNRNVSRMLYDQIADDVTAIDDNEKGKWEKLATEEVTNAVEALRSSV